MGEFRAGCGPREGDTRHAGTIGGLDPRRRIFHDHALLRWYAQTLSRDLKDLRIGFAPRDIDARDNRSEKGRTA